MGPDPCSLPMDGGPCRALKPRYYHNNGQCEQFIYGGCRGNANNFASLEACQARCLAGRQPVEQPMCHHGNQTFNLGDIVKLSEGSRGCCDTGYKCETVVHPPSLGGGGLLGGYRREALSAETKKVAAYAMKSVLSGEPLLHKGCDRLTLLEVLEVHRQIVAGTNFRLKLRLRNRIAPDCSNDEVRVCEVVIFRPLPHMCDRRDGCLQISNPASILCE